MTTTTIASEAAATAGPAAAGALRRAARWALELLRAVGEVYRKGGALPVLAPAIFAAAVLPEAAQHVAEIELGMFASREAFMAKAADPARMLLGGVKIAGLVLCVLLTARFWQCGSVKGALLMPRRDLGRTLFALAIGLAASLPAEWAAGTGQPPLVYWTVVPASWILSFLLLVYLVGALLGDRDMTLRAALTRGWKVLPPLALLTIAAFWPATKAHMWLHKLAIGASPATVWSLMAVDALLVGLLATLLGSALAVSYGIGVRSAGRA